MNDTISLFNPAPTTAVSPNTAIIELFDPPMCCPTGLCGPELDQTLLDVSEMLLTLKAEGTPVERYQMTSHPHQFMQNNEVMRLVRQQQMAALPITTVRGQVIKTGAYPSLAELHTALNIALAQ
jgi:hypothetical protein